MLQRCYFFLLEIKFALLLIRLLLLIVIDIFSIPHISCRAGGSSWQALPFLAVGFPGGPFRFWQLPGDAIRLRKSPLQVSWLRWSASFSMSPGVLHSLTDSPESRCLVRGLCRGLPDPAGPSENAFSTQGNAPRSGTVVLSRLLGDEECSQHVSSQKRKGIMLLVNMGSYSRVMRTITNFDTTMCQFTVWMLLPASRNSPTGPTTGSC